MCLKVSMGVLLVHFRCSPETYQWALPCETQASHTGIGTSIALGSCGADQLRLTTCGAEVNPQWA